MCQDTQKTARICTDGNARFMDKKIPTNFRNAGKITRKQIRKSKNLGELFQILLLGRAHLFGRILQLWEVVEQTKFSEI